MKKIILSMVLITLPFSLFALSNEDFEVDRVDVTRLAGIIWLKGGDIIDRAECDTKNYSAVACDIEEEFCKTMISVALFAKSTGTEVDFNYEINGQCIHNFAPVDRFRLSE